MLFESRQEGIYDATIAVVADEQLRDERARSRGHAAVDERAARQLSQAEKAASATYVVHNDGIGRGSAGAAVGHSCKAQRVIRRLPLLALGFAFAVVVALVLVIDMHHTREASLPLADTGDHSCAGQRKAPRPGADRSRDRRRVALRTATLERRCARADAAVAEHRRIPRAPLRRVRVQAGDLAAPRVNIAYGSYYLRYLLDHYDGNEMLALAAYNGGVGNVDDWVARERAQGRALTIEAIPYPETREYVRKVLEASRVPPARRVRARHLAPRRAARLADVPAFKLDEAFTPTADQPAAIESLAAGIANGERFQTLLGATGPARR